MSHVTIFLKHVRHVPKQSFIIPIMGSRVLLFAFWSGCTSASKNERGREKNKISIWPLQLLTLAGEGPLTKGGGARFFGLARGSSSWGAGPACLARHLKAAAKLLLFCCPPGPGPGVWPWGSIPELGRWDLPIEVGWALVLAGCKPERERKRSA